MKTPSVFETYPHGIYTDPQTNRNKTTYSLFKGFIKIKRDMPYDIPPHYDLKLMSNQQVKY
jgi:hypothetical protein